MLRISHALGEARLSAERETGEPKIYLANITDEVDRPIFFGVVKPNIGLSPDEFAEIARQSWLQVRMVVTVNLASCFASVLVGKYLVHLLVLLLPRC